MKTYWQAFKRMLKKEKDMIMSIKDMKINYSDIKMKYTTVFREIRQHYGLSWAIWIMWSTLIFEGIKGLILGSYLTPIPGLGPIAAGAHVIVALDRRICYRGTR